MLCTGAGKGDVGRKAIDSNWGQGAVDRSRRGCKRETPDQAKQSRHQCWVASFPRPDLLLTSGTQLLDIDQHETDIIPLFEVE